MALGILALHLAVAALQPATGYEFHRDQLLYLTMGKRLSLFGMESAPGIDDRGGGVVNRSFETGVTGRWIA